ncbi:hypothetical protein CPB83DRAFT_846750 [Crepidotus variabilis]|uniref:F-box domain-containing protein n=1 Tax=Crepidotus variabilis TaxID=179855 RepID=A0A9P6EPH1_9AGAR|nr:hypothetical protein CPB83DRAFT_846750 [Crepidotus variabilis]
MERSLSYTRLQMRQGTVKAPPPRKDKKTLAEKAVAELQIHSRHTCDDHCQSSSERRDQLPKAIASYEAYQEKDKRIAEVERMLANLKCERNELIPIAKLPPEILTAIFTSIACNSAYVFKPVASENIVLRYNFTYVCSTWRNIAISSPALWNILPVNATPINWIPLLIERSCDSDLTIRFADDDEDLESRVAYIFWVHGARIREIKLTRCSNQLIARLPTSTPRLTRLSLSADGDEDPVIKLPRSNTALRTLKLSAVNIDWNSYPISAGLTRLKIQDPPTHITWSLLLRMLRGMPSLRTLELLGAMSPFDPTSLPSNQSIILEDLVELSFSSSLRNTSNFLSLLAAPLLKSARLVFELEGAEFVDRPSISHISDFFSVLRTRPSTNNKFQTAVVESKPKALTYQLWRMKIDDPSRYLVAPDISLRFSSNVSFKTYLDEIIQSSVVSVGFQDVSILSLNLDADASAMASTFAKLPLVEKVVVPGNFDSFLKTHHDYCPEATPT